MSRALLTRKPAPRAPVPEPLVLCRIHAPPRACHREDSPGYALDVAALIGCGVTTGVGAVIHTAKVQPGETVAVIGGGIGLSAINGAAIAGAGRIIAIDMVPSKLELAKKFGATDVVNAKEVDPVLAVQEMTQGGVHYSFEAIGLRCPPSRPSACSAAAARPPSLA